MQQVDAPRPAPWKPHREPISATLIRTGVIGGILGLAASYGQGRPQAWLPYTALALWFSFGGHWVELSFLNWLRFRLPTGRWAQVAARLLVWLAGGTVLMVGGRATAFALGGGWLPLPPWWVGGPLLVGIELLVHAMLSLRGQPNFYDGRG